MTVSSTGVRQVYSGDGTTTVFAYSYPFFKTSDLIVLLVNADSSYVTQILGTNYTVTATAGVYGQFPSGSIVMGISPAVGQTLVIYRDPARTQGTHWVDNDSLPPGSIENAVDLNTMLIQRLYDLIGRGLVLSDAVPANFSLTLPAPLTPLYLLRINAAGTAIELATQQSFTFDSAAPSTTKGDLIVFNGAKNARHGVGTDGTVVIADSSQTDGIRWGNLPVLVPIFSAIIGSAAQVSAGIATHSTWASAIAAVSAGGSVFVLPGSWTENVDLTKKLNITGSGYGSQLIGTLTADTGCDHSSLLNFRISTLANIVGNATRIDLFVDNPITAVDNGTGNIVTVIQG